MIISARVIRTPRKARRCACGLCDYGRTPLLPGKPCLRLYGAAHRGDPPYVLYVDVGHADDRDTKIAAALGALVRYTDDAFKDEGGDHAGEKEGR